MKKRPGMKVKVALLILLAIAGCTGSEIQAEILFDHDVRHRTYGGPWMTVKAVFLLVDQGVRKEDVLTLTSSYIEKAKDGRYILFLNILDDREAWEKIFKGVCSDTEYNKHVLVRAKWDPVTRESEVNWIHENKPKLQ
jgi:hypothetical protein